MGRNEENYRAWRLANRERLAAKARAGRATNPEAYRSATARYRKQNAEKEKKRRREYMATLRASDPEQFRERQKIWFRENRDKARTYEAKQKARRKGAEGKHTYTDVKIILEAQQQKCFYCEVPLKTWHEDHFVALSKGGTNYRHNIVLTCVQCNLKKGNKSPVEFMNWKMKLPVFWREGNHGSETV